MQAPAIQHLDPIAKCCLVEDSLCSSGAAAAAHWAKQSRRERCQGSKKVDPPILGSDTPMVQIMDP